MYDFNEREKNGNVIRGKEMKASICFEMLYSGLNPVDKVKNIAKYGFEYFEFWSWRDKDLDELKQLKQTIGMKTAIFSGQRKGDLIQESTHDILLDDLEDALSGAKLLGNNTLMILTQELGDEGVVMNKYQSSSDSEKRNSLVIGLRKILEVIPTDFNIVIEPLNTVLDHVGYYLYDIPKAVDIIKEIDDKRLSILCDLYHQGMMGDDLLSIIENYAPYIGYYHIADIPTRHEPRIGQGAIDWQKILTSIKQSGYTGFVGFEFSPEGDSDNALRSIQELWQSVL